MKRIFTFGLIMILIIFNISVVAAGNVEINLDGNRLQIKNIPNNAIAATVIYTDEMLSEVKLFTNSENVEFDCSTEFASWNHSNELKVFVWDKNNLEPLCNSESYMHGDNKFDLERGVVMLNNGIEMPILGIGTYTLSQSEAENSVYWALRDGYRLIDTARIYGNESGVGRGIKRAIDEGFVTREEIFVTTKMWTSDYSNGNAAINASLERLGLDYIDLMILHHSQPRNDVDAYKAMESAVRDGRLHSIGLSNYYTSEDFDRLVNATTIAPVLLQNETHPYYQGTEMKEHLKQYGTIMESWYPLGGRGQTQILFGDETVAELAQAHSKTPAQIILRWHLQAGNIVIPGSSNESHIQENNDIFDFELSEEEMQKMSALDKNQRFSSY